ncbi:MAG: hypothetical protein HY081_06985 [Gammaproteobacteria bacterium]|nr:hypothetical protein [Gammaproteobacteria bacterium]
MNSNLLCRKLLASWALTAIALLLMARYGHLGLLMAIVPAAIAQNIRLAHDKAAFERLREKKFWKSFALLYYLALLFVTIFALTRDIRLDELPIVAFIVMVMFPIFVAMIVSDFQLCSDKDKAGVNF